MQDQRRDNQRALIRSRIGLFAICTALLALSSGVLARDVDVTVISPSVEGVPIGTGFRWVLQEDATYEAIPGTPLEDQLATNLHTSHMPVVSTGTSGGSATTTVTVPNDSKRYYLSVLPDQPDGVDCQGTNDCYTMGGKQIFADLAQTDLYVVVTPQPLRTAQIYIMVHADNSPINTRWDAAGTEPGLGGFDILISDFSAGILSVDNYGNPLGTEYELDVDGLTPIVKRLGDGTVHSMTAEEVNDPARNPYGLEVGEALVKNLAPGKYGVNIVPPQGENWQQTSTLEGSKTIDAWVKAGEPRISSEFDRRGPRGHHVTFGFVRPEEFAPLTGTGTIIGQNRSLGFRRVPDAGFDLKDSTGISPCYIGLNDAAGVSSLYAASCNDDDSFVIENVPAGSYQVMIFDRYLGNIFNLQSVTVGDGEAVDMGDIGTFRWFASLEQWSFYDANEDGQWQRNNPAEYPLDEQAALLRYRDGTIYQASATDFDGFVPFDEIFPWFNFLVAEIDFARFKHTGTTVVVDNGGTPSTDLFGEGKRNPQLQDPADGGTNCTVTNGTGQTGCVSRTETGPALLEGYNKFLGFNSRIEWGKKEWEEGENGGISGIVYYATTRAEDDVRFAAAEPWEPGIPRVQISLYMSDNLGNILENNGSPDIQYADIDNHPLGWAEGELMGPEDVENSTVGGVGVFDIGDAIEFAHTDSFDDSPVEGCPADSNTWDPANPDPFHLPPGGSGTETQFNGRCYDGLRNFNQIRPAVFDGGFGLGPPWTGMDDVDNAPTGDFPGTGDVDHNGNGIFDDIEYLPSGFYVLEAATPPGYTTTASSDKNVDFGDTFTLNPLALPPICVGADDVIATDEELNLFPGVDAPFQGTTRKLCDRKLVQVADGKNMAADFFLHTETPVAGQFKGIMMNDLANEFDALSPNFGEKFAPANIPISVRDWAGNEVYRTTTDSYGVYNVLAPSAYRINTPMASGVSENMLQVCLNSPLMENPAFVPTVAADPVSNPRMIPDPHFNKQYSQFCYTFNAHTGSTTYLDTPIFGITAFSGSGNWQLDCEYPTLTPVIHTVSVEGNLIGGGPYVTTTDLLDGESIVITSVGMADVPDPNFSRIEGEDDIFITRNFGFGGTVGTVTINGVPLTIDTWTDGVISATMPSGTSTGQLEVTRGDNGVSTVTGITVIVDDGSIPSIAVVNPADSIQEAIDAADPGGLVMVTAGSYNEALFITKPVQLQGWGSRTTTLLASLSPSEKLQEWRETANNLANCTGEIGLLTIDGAIPAMQANNQPNIAAACGFTPGSGLFGQEEAPGILVAPRTGVFDGSTQARIDGFSITGALKSHGIFVNGNADFLEISNNLITGNQAAIGAGGIRVGNLSFQAGQTTDSDNDFVNIHHNDVSQNGSIGGFGAGIGIYNGTDNYSVTNNFVCGNFVQGDGGGIAHYGLSRDGLIADNNVILNQSFAQTPGLGTNGGGILVSGQGRQLPNAGDPPAVIPITLSPGTGNVKVLRNHVQSNNAGSGDGGGIALVNINGQDVLASANEDTWHHVDVLNNFVINNVAGMTGGGISIKDGVKVSIVNNTVMNNDSTGTAFNAFGTCPEGTNPTRSCPQTAGISAYAHSADLLGTGGNVGTFSDPTMINNIVLGNRSQYWEVSFNSEAGFDTGELIIEQGPSDFGVFPVAAGTLTTMYSIFTTGNDTASHVLGGLVGGSGLPTGPYLQAGGILSVEAEHFATNVAAGGAPAWGVLDPSADASGTMAIKANGTQQTYSAGSGSSISYEVNLDAGTQYVWARFRSFSFIADSFFFQLDGGAIQTRGLGPDDGQWHWIEVTPPVNVAVAGVHTLTIYRREMAVEIDKLVVTSNSAYNPETVNAGLGPDESLQAIGPGTNLEVDGTITAGGCTDDSGECGIVINPYRNSAPGFVTVQPDGTVIPLAEFPTDVAPAFDEGGNFLDVHYGPLSQAGNYHLQTTSPNIAIDAGASPTSYADRSLDIDRDARPQGISAVAAEFDIGADEVPGVPGTDSNQAPQIMSPANGNGANNISSYEGIPFALQVRAMDANGDNLTYSLCRDTGGGCLIGNLPAGMAINASSGLISWPLPPAPVGGAADILNDFQVSVSDGMATTTHTFRIRVRAANAPDAVNDIYETTNYGQFVVEGPSILGNDTIPNEVVYGTALASLETLLPSSAGFVALEGAPAELPGDTQIVYTLIYTPVPDFIGTADFMYRLSNDVGSDVATVTLARYISLTDSRYEPLTGMYVFNGYGVPGEQLSISLDPSAGPSIPLGVTTVAGDGTWSLSVAGAPPVDGDVIDIQGDMGAPLHSVNDAPLLSTTAAGNNPSSTAYVQCPGDTDGDAIIDDPAAVAGRQVVCKHLGAGDGFSVLGDGRELYGFSFNDLTGVPQNQAIDKGILNAQFPAPTLEFDEGDEVYLTLTNVAMLIRPDLFDPHTVHFHGFPNASSTFDGVPESSVSINGGFSLTYYYNVVEPGTYMYHCHVEAAEHMQMGMLGNLYVNPAQNGSTFGGYDKFVYNDGDGSTGYDQVVPIQIGSFDSAFHDASFLVQPLGFAEMHDDYPLLNGRGYPHTVDPNPIPSNSPAIDCDTDDTNAVKRCAGVTSSNESSQVVSSRIVAMPGERILLRVSNLNVTQFNTLATTGLTMQVVGTGAKILRGPGGTAANDLYYETNSVTLGGGQAMDVLIDTTGVPEGTYLLYSTNLNNLSNGTEDFGGMMTEIVITNTPPTP